MYNLTAKERQGEISKSSTRGLYRDARIPGVVYDHTGVSLPVSLDRKDADLLIKKRGTSGLIQLTVEKAGGNEVCNAVFKNLQYDHLRNNVIHMEFQRTVATVPVKIRVPIKGTGTPHGVLRQGGVLQQNAQESEILCLPADIPDCIQVDVSHLKLNEVIRARDIEGFKFSLPQQSFFTVASSRAARKIAAKA